MAKAWAIVATPVAGLGRALVRSIPCAAGATVSTTRRPVGSVVDRTSCAPAPARRAETTRSARYSTPPAVVEISVPSHCEASVCS